MAEIVEHRKTGIGNAAVSINVNQVDNELLIALNGTQIARLTGPGNPVYQENLSQYILAGRPNVLVLTLANFSGGGFNPATCQAVLNVGNEEINLGVGSVGNAPEGVYAQSIIILER